MDELSETGYTRATLPSFQTGVEATSGISLWPKKHFPTRLPSLEMSVKLLTGHLKLQTNSNRTLSDFEISDVIKM